MILEDLDITARIILPLDMLRRHAGTISLLRNSFISTNKRQVLINVRKLVSR
jgi:hypothetical protein